jgi:DNA-directed RNA polymerase specialized sigma subunit
MARDREAPETGYEASNAVRESGASLPQLPDEIEARCYLLIKREDLPQKKIAAQLKITQGAVSKAYARACRKIDDLVGRGLVSLDRLELELRRGVSLAART